MAMKRVGLRYIALILSVGLFVAGCAGTETGEAPGTTVAGETPGTTLDRVVVALGPVGVETNRSWTVTEFTLIQLEPIFESLLSNDPMTGEAVPSLAESWGVSEDLRTWSFKLREGVQFHNGWGEFTSEDVLHSWGLWTSEDSISAMRPAFLTANVTAPGPYEVIFEFETPRFDGIDIFTRLRTQGYIYSKAQFDAEGLEGYDELPAGTGFFKYKERREGQYLLFERNTDHWSGTAAEYEELEFRWQPENSTRLAMLLSGEAHIAAVSRELQPQAVESGMTVIPGRTSSYQSVIHFGGTLYNTPGFDPDMTDPFVESALVRQAINKAIDRQAILDEIYLGETGGSQLVILMGFTPEREGWNEAWVADFEEYYGYDPERALQLIADAGYSPADIRPVLRTYEVAGSPEYGLLMEAIQINLAEIGIEATIENVDVQIQVTEARGMTLPRNSLNPIRNTPIRPSLEWVRNNNQSFEPGWPMYSHEEVQELFEEWDQTLDRAERNRIGQLVGDHLFYNFTTVPIVQTGVNMIVNPEFISGWVYPGVTSAGLTHFELIRPAG